MIGRNCFSSLLANIGMEDGAGVPPTLMPTIALEAHLHLVAEVLVLPVYLVPEIKAVAGVVEEIMDLLVPIVLDTTKVWVYPAFSVLDLKEVVVVVVAATVDIFRLQHHNPV